MESISKSFPFYKEPPVNTQNLSEHEFVLKNFNSCRGVKYTTPLIDIEKLTPFVKEYLKKSSKSTAFNKPNMKCKPCKNTAGSSASQIKNSSSEKETVDNRKISAELKLTENSATKKRGSNKITKRSRTTVIKSARRKTKKRDA